MATVKTLIGNIKGKPGADGDKNVYSANETVIGTWNGSTLYRRVFSKTVSPTSSAGVQTVTTIGSLGISGNKIIQVSGTAYYSSNDTTFVLPHCAPIGSGGRMGISISNGAISFLNSFEAASSMLITVVIDYIK